MRLNRSYAIILLCMLLANCTSEAPYIDPTSVAEEVLPVSTESPAIDSKQAAEGVTTITFGEQSAFRQLYQPVIDQFNAENPTIRVQFVAIDEAYRDANASIDTLYAQVVRLADTATLPSASPLVLRKLVRSGLIGDLRPFMDSDAAFNRADFYPNMLDSALVDDGIYLLPRSIMVSLLFYNKDLFAQRGVPLPTTDATWRELREAARTLARKTDGEQDMYGFVDVLNQQPVSLELADAGYDLSQPAGANLKLDSPEATEALDRAAALIRSNAVFLPANPPGDYSDFELVAQLVRNQRIGMWDQPLGSPPPAFEVGLLPNPYDTTIGYPAGYVISGGTRNAEGAWRWLTFLSANEPPYSNQQAYIGIVPARKSFAERSGYWERLNGDETAVINAILERPASSATNEPNPIVVHRDLLIQAVRAVANGTQSATQAAAVVQEQLDQRVAAAPIPSAVAGPVVVNTPVPPPAQPDAVPITFGMTNLDDADLAPLIQTFAKQHPEIAVQLTSLRGANTRSLSAAAANLDCFDSFRIPQTADSAALLDLRPLLDADTTGLRDDYAPVLLAPLQQDGRLDGLPLSFDLPAVRYNPDAFAAANLPSPSAEWTLDDFLATAQQLTDDNGEQKHYGFAVLGDQTEGLATFLRMSGVGPATIRGDTLIPTFTTPDLVAALQRYLALLQTTSPHEHLGDYSPTGTRELADSLVQSGRVGMWLDTRGTIGATTAATTTGTLIPLPEATGSTLAPQVTQTLYISARTTHPEACWTWLTFLSSQLTAVNSGFPARTSLATSATFTEQAPAGAIDLYTAYGTLLNNPSNTSVQTALFDAPRLDMFWFYRAVDRALAGKNLQQELSDAQTITEAYLACVQGGTIGPDCATQVDPTYAGWQQTSQ